MQSRIDCTCMFFPQSEISCIFSNHLPEQMHIRIGCIHMIFLPSETSNAFSNRLTEQLQNYIGGIDTAFHQSVYSYVCSICRPEQMQSHIVHICKTSHCFDFASRDSHRIWRSVHSGDQFLTDLNLQYKKNVHYKNQESSCLTHIIKTFTFLKESHNIHLKLLFQRQIQRNKIKRICLHKC